MPSWHLTLEQRRQKAGRLEAATFQPDDDNRDDHARHRADQPLRERKWTMITRTIAQGPYSSFSTELYFTSFLPVRVPGRSAAAQRRLPQPSSAIALIHPVTE